MKSVAPEPFLLRIYDPEKDYPTLCEWWRARGKNPPLRELLPKLAVVAHRGDEDAAMGFLFMDNSTGVCFFEMPVSRPGMALSDVRRAFEAVMGFLKMRAAQLGYVVMYGYTLPAIAREARRLGFHKQRENMVMIYSILREEAQNGHGG